MSVNPLLPTVAGGCGGGNSGGGAGGSGGGSGGGGGGGGGPCGACKFLRRKCVPGCVFAPHFDSEQGASHFAAVHKVFGASNVSKLLSSIPPDRRQDAVLTVCYEAQARVRDPVYGCVSHIFGLQQQVMALQAELSFLQAQVMSMTTDIPARPPQPVPPPPLQHPVPIMPPVPAPNLPPAMYPHPPYDMPPLYDPIMNQQAQWAAMQRPIDPRPPVGLPSTVGDLQALAGELMRGQRNPPQPPPGPTTSPSSPTIPKRE